MSQKTLSELAKKMRGIDLTMLLTRTEDENIAGRPMSNNGEVDYDGSSYYFTWGESRMVADIERDDKVALAFQGKNAFFRLGRRESFADSGHGRNERPLVA